MFQPHIDDMTSPMPFGKNQNPFYLGARELGVVERTTIADLLMPFFGACAREHRGVIYHPTSAAGATLIGVSFVGETAAYGNDCLKL